MAKIITTEEWKKAGGIVKFEKFVRENKLDDADDIIEICKNLGFKLKYARVKKISGSINITSGEKVIFINDKYEYNFTKTIFVIAFLLGVDYIYNKEIKTLLECKEKQITDITIQKLIEENILDNEFNFIKMAQTSSEWEPKDRRFLFCLPDKYYTSGEINKKYPEVYYFAKELAAKDFMSDFGKSF